MPGSASSRAFGTCCHAVVVTTQLELVPTQVAKLSAHSRIVTQTVCPGVSLRIHASVTYVWPSVAFVMGHLPHALVMAYDVPEPFQATFAAPVPPTVPSCTTESVALPEPQPCVVPSKLPFATRLCAAWIPQVNDAGLGSTVPYWSTAATRKV